MESKGKEMSAHIKRERPGNANALRGRHGARGWYVPMAGALIRTRAK